MTARKTFLPALREQAAWRRGGAPFWLAIGTVGSYLLPPTIARAQTPAAQPPAAASPTVAPPQRYSPPPPEPAINPDGTVIFSLKAPDAKTVAIQGMFGNAPMTRDDNGVWSFTAASLTPEIYEYHFVVDGVAMLDPRNKWSRGNEASLLCIPAPAGKAPAPWEVTNVPHGAVTTAFYTSAAAGGAQRRVHIYTPPGYDSRKRDEYPTFYLLHGSGDDDASWVDVSHANFIFDNLIAAKAMRPMIVVMPYGFMPRGSAREAFGSDVVDNLMPYVEQNYRVKHDASDRALGGLSMGGGQTIQIGLTHADRFAYLGAWSSGLGGADPAGLDRQFPDIAKEGAKALPGVKKIYLSCGKIDRLLPTTQAVDGWLTTHQIPHEMQLKEGSHQWSVWRASLIEFASELFKN